MIKNAKNGSQNDGSERSKNYTEIRSLPLELERNRFSYTQVLRGKGSCIYRQWVSEKVNYYEVFRIKIKARRTIQGRELEATEIFPHDEAFGYWAWTFRSYKKAYKRFLELERSISKVN